MTSDYGRDNDGRNEFRRDERAESYRRDEPSDDPRQEGFRTSEPKSGVGCKIIAGCLFFVFLFFLCIGGGVLFYFHYHGQFDPVCQEFLRLADQGKTDVLYDQIHPDWQQQVTEEAFDALIKYRSTKLGALQEATLITFDFKSANGIDESTINYQATFEKGDAAITFTLKTENDVWKVTGVQYESSALNASAVCPNCQTPLDPNAKFCASCGREITPFDWYNNMEEEDSYDESIEEDAVEPLEPESEAVR